MNEFKPRDLLAAEYVLGTLRGGARRRFEHRLQQEPMLAREVAGWQQAFAQLDLHDAPIQPPERVWQAISNSISPQADDHTQAETGAANHDQFAASFKRSDPVRVPAYRRAGLWQLTSAALAACLVIALLWPVSTVHKDVSSSVQPIAILSPTSPDSAAHLIAGYDARQRTLVFTPLNVVAPDSQHSLQLWRIGADKKPVSLGLLNRSGATQFSAEQLPALDGITLAVSLEPAAGSPTGQPTGRVLYAGVVTIALNNPEK
ncbi:anti-sigma K factor RskA [Advenella kashmirensis WT001]|uniref:Anti-sigma K factor RskA n=1 Tax=Advenella kashmirensis (strain DSM 17095 / LMG 22695 / WT001) TaxID=1036672 RepID=I3UER9_ADVKW|nr:anti-sigma factor [Advenella kashmirensis]AFK63507.1 anti-sigma K factor RskA [Advenella kashmirensis WT001]